ncbi:MAG: hypothetical protein IKE28_04785 [Solobacterium sp.]|nr:hypothetical protein [Solobacterium sp.]
MISEEVKEYIESHKLCSENLFEDWEAFLDFLYPRGGRVEAILWFERVLIDDQELNQYTRGYEDVMDPTYMYLETKYYEDGFEFLDPDDIKVYIESMLEDYEGQDMKPSFYLFEENDAMDLKQYDGKCVRIMEFSRDNFEGICSYDSAEYNKHEFNRYEESLSIVNLQFYKSQIAELESLEHRSGPYGRYSAPFGKAEMLAVEDGADSVAEFLNGEDRETVVRMLRCLDQYLDPKDPDVMQELKNLVQQTGNEEIREMAQKLIDRAAG